MDPIKQFLDDLQKPPEIKPVFNPWWENDRKNDGTPEAPQKRRENLSAYFSERLDNASILLLGEAMGYQGGHFSGVPMTSERILLGKQEKKGLNRELICSGIKNTRTSHAEIFPDGFNEPTATIVWESIKESSIDSRRILIWNAFPWHPYKKENILSNRTPVEYEMDTGMKILRNLYDIFQINTTIAVGKKAEKLLKTSNLACFTVRHPANGGATKFRHQFREIISTQKLS